MNHSTIQAVKPLFIDSPFFDGKCLLISSIGSADMKKVSKPKVRR